MLSSARTIFEAAAVVLSAASVGYCALAAWSVRAFLREWRTGTRNSFTPPVSILKPLKGCDPEMYACFRSHCLQDYPEYEIIFGVSEADDPAVALVEQLKAEFPAGQIRLVFCRDILGPNVKVSNLEQMLPQARYEHLVVNDSDIRVESDYLRKVIAPIEQPEVGLVTCLYRGMDAATVGSKLEALGISADFVPGVLSAWKMENGIRFGLGSTLALRRNDLQAVGGFQSLLEYLADDYQLGKSLSERGLEICISESIVATHLPKYSLASYLRHQLRWARTVRDARRWGYLGTSITFGLFWAILTVILSAGAGWSWALLAVTAASRAMLAIISGEQVLQDRRVYSQLWLLPFRDVLGFSVWLASFFGHTISWRGREFILRKGKLFVKLHDASERGTPATES